MNQTARDLSQMSLDELRTFEPRIASDVFDVLTLEGSVAARDHLGGTAPNQVHAASQRARLWMEAFGRPDSEEFDDGD